MHWPFAVLAPEKSNGGKGTEEADKAKEAKGMTNKCPCGEGWYLAGGHVTCRRGVDLRCHGANIDGTYLIGLQSILFCLT